MPETPRQTGNTEVNFRGKKRSNATHASVTDSDARHFSKKAPNAAAMRCFMGHTLMENRKGLAVLKFGTLNKIPIGGQGVSIGV